MYKQGLNGMDSALFIVNTCSIIMILAVQSALWWGLERAVHIANQGHETHLDNSLMSSADNISHL